MSLNRRLVFGTFQWFGKALNAISQIALCLLGEEASIASTWGQMQGIARPRRHILLPPKISHWSSSSPGTWSITLTCNQGYKVPRLAGYLYKMLQRTVLLMRTTTSGLQHTMWTSRTLQATSQTLWPQVHAWMVQCAWHPLQTICLSHHMQNSTHVEPFTFPHSQWFPTTAPHHRHHHRCSDTHPNPSD